MLIDFKAYQIIAQSECNEVTKGKISLSTFNHRIHTTVQSHIEDLLCDVCWYCVTVVTIPRMIENIHKNT